MDMILGLEEQRVWYDRGILITTIMLQLYHNVLISYKISDIHIQNINKRFNVFSVTKKNVTKNQNKFSTDSQQYKYISIRNAF